MLLNARQIFREKIGANILLLAIEDITERKMAEKMREDIDRITRHDLKTPLNPIIGFPELLLLDTNLTPEQIECIQLIRSSGYRMLSIIDSSLSLYKMEQGTYTLTPVCFDLFQLLTSIERESALEFEKKRLKLVRFQVGKGVEGADVFMINGEELLCYTMLANLIKNAIEASPPDEVITVSCEEDALWNFISIHNKGTVPEKIRPGFFDKYITSGKKTGTGLGTYSAMLAARTQKGDISMTTSEEKGTLITVRLPKLLHTD
jgi:signal transduction histidine kinase